MVILLCLLCAAPAAAQAGHRHARAASHPKQTEATPLAPAKAAPLDRVDVAPRRLTGYVMTDSNIKTAVEAWLSDSAAAEATYGHISTWETGGVTNMRYLFCASGFTTCNSAAVSFNEDIGAWDTSGVTDMYAMFYSTSAFDQDLGWCVNDDVDLDYAFDNTPCESTSCGIAGVDCDISRTGNIMVNWKIKQAVAAWFSDATAAAEATYGHISTWETAQVTDMSKLFFRARTFDEDISAWDTSGATTMKFMFDGASSFNRPVGGWRVDRVRSMASMFGGANAFNQPIGNWSVGAVTNMNGMFEDAPAFNQDIGGWQISSVIEMKKMFYGASSFDQDMGDWAVHSVTEMGWMFHSATAFNQDLGDWRIDNVQLMGAQYVRARLRLQPGPRLVRGPRCEPEQRVPSHQVRVDVVRRHARHLLGPGIESARH